MQQISTEDDRKSGMASFSHDDKLIAVNSSVYDSRTSKKVHSFMDFGSTETACFHPNNIEYIKGQYVVSFSKKLTFVMTACNVSVRFYKQS